MSEAARRVQQAARDARSNDDLVRQEWPVLPGGPDTEQSDLPPLDEETLDEQASTQMGQMWELPRRYSE